MDVSKLVEAIKEFFFDILGFLIPGVFLILLMFISLEPVLTQVVYSKIQLKISAEYSVVLFLLTAYVLGYMTYGLALIRDDFFQLKLINSIINFFRRKKIFSLFIPERPVDILTKIQNSVEFKICKGILIKLLSKDIIIGLTNDELDSLSSGDVRNIIISYIPDQEKKIYTFRFRAELCNHLGVVSFLIGIIGLSFVVFERLFSVVLLMLVSNRYAAFYFFLILSGLLLAKTRSRFLSISYRVPFSMFISKYYQIKQQ